MPLIGIKNAIDRRDIYMISCEGLPIRSQWNLIWLKKKVFPATFAFKECSLENRDQITDTYSDWVTKE
jgi:hypothetical protein